MTPSREEPSTDAASTEGPNLGFVLPSARRIPRRRLATIGLIALCVLAIAFALGYLPRRGKRAALQASAESAQRALPRIEVVAPKVGASDRALELPGAVRPLQETVLFARASGYVRAWRVDIGDKVKKGEILAEIETPELDQELSQAQAQLLQTRASLLQAKANRDLAKANLARAKRLAPSGIVSKADLDQSEAQAQVGEANVSVADANVAAQQANIRRLNQLKDFAKVTAPFAGTITQRMVEVGYFSQKVRAQYDCTDRRVRRLSVWLHAGHMGEGKVIYADDTPHEWEAVEVGTLNESLWKIACK